MAAAKEKPKQGEDAIKTFDQRSDVAISTISLPVHDSNVSPVIDLKNPKDVWDTLSKQYKSARQASRNESLENYQNFKMKPDETVIQF